MSDVQQEIQKLAPDAPVELFELNLNPIGLNEFYYFTKAPKNSAGTSVAFGGITYYPVNLESDGWEYTGVGAFPQPKLTISNVFSFLSGLLYSANDLVGAKVTRTRTFAQFLDDGVDPDTSQILPQDIYYVHQKSGHTADYIEFTLAAAMDQQGLMLPRRKMLRDVCTHTYRKWTGSDWDYSNASCRYSDTKMFDSDNNRTYNEAKDNCSRELDGCIARFHRQALPTRAFPGIIRMRLT